VPNIPAPDHAVELIAGALPLDFTNTLGGTHRAPTHEHLQGYADLVDFVRVAGALTPAETKRLLADAERRPAAATDVLRRGVALREAIWRVFDALATGRTPQSVDLALLNREAADAFGHARVVREGETYGWGWTDEPALERPLWPIARAAAELLTDRHSLARLRECASETCEWLFIDRSRNGSRRWCDMNDCGNRAKVRRFRQRQRAPRSRASR
jgi:predicted RNA-binding Zn ribbon-like protein